MAFATPLVSIITPTYRHGPWIGPCLDSVRRQTYGHWEQIVVDDGSPDETERMVAPYLQDPRVRYIRQPNGGIWRLGEAYNRALAMARGELIAVLEGDDFWLEDRLALQVPAFNDPTVGFAYGRILVADDAGAIVASESHTRNQWRPPFASFASDSPLPFLRDLLLLRGNVGAVTMMFRRSALEAVGGFWQPAYFPAVDFTTVLRVATTQRTAFMDQSLGVWRRHDGQTTDLNNLAYCVGHSRAAVEHFNGLPEATRRQLNLTEGAIWRARRHYLADAYWRAARLCMGTGDWANVRRYGWEMVKRGSALRRLEGAAAVSASLFRLNLNALVEGAAATPVGRGIAEREAGGTR